MKDLTPLITEISHKIHDNDRYVLPNWLNVTKDFDYQAGIGCHMSVGVSLTYNVLLPENQKGQIDHIQQEVNHVKRLFKDRVYGNLYSELLDVYTELRHNYPPNESLHRLERILGELR